MSPRNPSHIPEQTIRPTIQNNLSGLVLTALLFVGAIVTANSNAYAQDTQPIRIVAFGDSLVAGYGLSLKDALPEQILSALKAKNPDLEIINAGVSGDTSGAALARLDWSFPAKADGAIVLLGGNDFLRGLSPKQMTRNLDAIMTKLQQRKLEVLILGMKAPRNTGKAYYQPFDAAFPTLAKKYDAILDPFYLEGVAGSLEFNQLDGLHPNAKGVAKIVKRILPQVEELIARIRTARKSGTTN